MSAPRMLLLTSALLLGLSLPATQAADDPLELEPTDDTFLSSEHTGKPAGRGDHPEMQIYGKTDHTLFRALIEFNLKAAPAGFKGAILRLTCYNGHFPVPVTSFLRVHAITAPWDQEAASWDMRGSKANWNHPGGDFDPKPVCAALVMGPFGGEKDRTYDFDLTSIAQQWQAQPNSNHGVIIMLEKGCTAELRFRSKEFANAAARPKLLLYYQKAPQKDSFVLAGNLVPPYEPYDPAAPLISLGNKPALKIGEEFSTKFSASNGKEPYFFVPASPAIPGLSLAPDGTLKGKPSKAGAFIFGVTCTAGNGKKANDWQRWVVVDPNAKPPEVVKKDDEKKPPEKKPDKPDKPDKPPEKKPEGPAEE